MNDLNPARQCRAAVFNAFFKSGDVADVLAELKEAVAPCLDILHRHNADSLKKRFDDVLNAVPAARNGSIPFAVIQELIDECDDVLYSIEYLIDYERRAAKK